MNHKLEIQITNSVDVVDNGINKLNPCESYAEQLLADAKAGFQKYRWEAIPCDECSYSPTFKITDDAAGLVTEVSRTDNTGKLVRYTMCTTAADGGVIYSAMEMVTPEENESVLRDIYLRSIEHIMEKDNSETAREPIEPEDDSLIVDNFVQALLQDARARTPSLMYTRQSDDSFVCESFGISETRIVLKKDFESDHSDKYTVSLEYPDGSEVISCMEVSELDVASDLRELYNLISQQYPETYKDLAVKDAERFICNMRYQKMLDRVLTYAIEPIKSDAPPGEGRWLVMDIIKAAPSARVITRHLIDELNRRQGVLPPSEEMRIRQLVESTVNSIIHMKREPNGFTFTGRGVPMAHDQNNRPVRDCRWSSSLSRTANSWTTWPADVYGSDVDMNSKTVLTRIATLIVAAVLCDQLK